MAKDYYLQRKNRRTRKSNILLVNSLEDDGKVIVFFRGAKRPGSNSYRCGRNRYEVASSAYEYVSIGNSCSQNWPIFELREKQIRIDNYIEKKNNEDSDPVIAD